jgi:hypothetical protein
MELENIVANTVYLKAREGTINGFLLHSQSHATFSLVSLKVAPTAIKERVKSGVKFYNFHTYLNA